MNSQPVPSQRRIERDRPSNDDVQLLDERLVTTLDDDPSEADRPTEPADERWQQIQSEFVDDPRRSLSGAHAIVSELIDSIVHDLERGRDDLKRQWPDEGEFNTEEMRLCFQRYRDFYHQLLFRAAEGAGRTSATLP